MTALPLTMTEAAGRLRQGSLTAVELLRGMSARADAHDEQLGVYLARFDDEALASAERADAELADGVDRGPLHGIPIGIKDIVAMSEGPTTAQSLILDPAWGEGKDAPVTTRLKEAGAVITGKLTLMEFAIGGPDADKPFPLPRNPWNTDTWSGGSSSGTGAGVAAGMFLAGVGTDTGGSIRLPAIFCGVSGLMPTFGRVPNSGCVPLAYSLDHIGPLARSARDCGAFLGAIAGPDPTDPYAKDVPVPDFCVDLNGSLEGVRIGLERANHFGEDDDPALAACFEAAVAELELLGATVVEVVIPHYAEACTAFLVTLVSEGLAYHRQDLSERWGDYFAATRMALVTGALVSGADYVQAQRVRRVAQRGLARLFADVDLIVAPAARRGAMTCDELLSGGLAGILAAINTEYWDLVGNPAMVVPMGFTDDGLPLSLQFAARPFEEALLVRAGDAFQQVTDWHLRVPPLVADSTVNA